MNTEILSQVDTIQAVKRTVVDPQVLKRPKRMERLNISQPLETILRQQRKNVEEDEEEHQHPAEEVREKQGLLLAQAAQTTRGK